MGNKEEKYTLLVASWGVSQTEFEDKKILVKRKGNKVIKSYGSLMTKIFDMFPYFLDYDRIDYGHGAHARNTMLEDIEKEKISRII